MSIDNQDTLIQVTFHFVNGQNESFNVLWRADASLTLQDIHQKTMKLLEKPWCVLHLPEQTVCIMTANVLKVEIKPSLDEIQGEGVFSDARRVSAFTRTSQR